MTLAIVLTGLSALLLLGFIIIGVNKFGLLSSYSAYSEKWETAVPIDNANLWSIVTFAAAALLMPVMIQLASVSVLQFLGFLTPLYLIGVALTPEWYKDKKSHIFHSIFAFLSAFGGIYWCMFIMHGLYIFIAIIVVVIISALITKTLKSCGVFWLELIMFLTVYLTTFMSLL